MLDKLLLLFVLLPLVELVLLTTLSYYTSLSTAILFIIVTGILGTWLARTQGTRAYWRIQQELAAGRMPTDALIDGALILLAGVLLITPGVLTDLVGVFLMFPPTRHLAKLGLAAWIKKHFKIHTISTQSTFRSSDVVDSYATSASTSTEDSNHLP